MDEISVKKWSNRLRRLIADAPPGMTALVHHGAITICESDVVRAYEKENTHRDNVPFVYLIPRSSVFEPNSEST